MNRPVLSLLLLTLLAGCDMASNSDSSTPDEQPTADGDAAAVVLPSAKAKQIVAGRLHACALTEAGEVRCWGYDPHVGTIGVGEDLSTATDKTYPSPVAVVGLSGIKQIAAKSSDFTCALTNAGGVKCWGDDEGGRLGTGIPYTDNSAHASSTPKDVQGLASGVESIGVGGDHGCALMTDHTVQCWGINGAWIGDGTDHIPGDTATPNLVTAHAIGLSGVAQISVGFDHTCAVMETGTVKCWGDNGFGEVGTGTDSPRILVPTDVAGLTNVAKVVAGDRLSCAVMKDGSAACWGTREFGSLGDGKKDSFDLALLPVVIPNPGGPVTDITTNNGFACAIVSGSVKCWGDSEALGYEDRSFRTYVPKDAVKDLPNNVVEVVNGGEYGCARLAGGEVKCWGTNGGGQLGDGKGGKDGSEFSATPVGVLSLP